MAVWEGALPYRPPPVAVVFTLLQQRIAYLGPQARFPVPEGILEYDGTK